MAFSFDQTLDDVGYLTVLKDAPNAIKFVQHGLTADVQASTMELFSHSGVDLGPRQAFVAGAEVVAGHGNPNNVMLDADCRTDNFEDVTRQFKEQVLVQAPQAKPQQYGETACKGSPTCAEHWYSSRPRH